ncbi:hypothetical protein A6768_11960 [Sphingobium yanoikuyae]|uniref:Uncharacterized protein n=1 Tax=Sphingobium yanoikuyae TaxID=13690 RepID=A0A291MZX6_SPHYA|nr:hypothetical protein A6768_11960 [Sphingobium yanoikuyae]
MEWCDPPSFQEAFRLHLERHGETYYQLHRSIIQPGDRMDRATLQSWLEGRRTPRSAASFAMRRYALPAGYFKAKLPNPSRAASGLDVDGVSRAEQRRLAWHLPDDFNSRSLKERKEILEWVRTRIISGATEYRRFQAQAMKLRYAIRFPTLMGRKAQPSLPTSEDHDFDDQGDLFGVTDAPARLAAEMAELIRFKTATLTDIGFQRIGVWNEETTFQKIEHFGLMFGALAASPRGAVHGHGVPLKALSLALLISPRVWDWYVQWRERRRGFFTRWECDMLRNAMALVRTETGWLRQHPELAARLVPIPDLISAQEVKAIQADWQGACDLLQARMPERASEKSIEWRGIIAIHSNQFCRSLKRPARLRNISKSPTRY